MRQKWENCFWYRHISKFHLILLQNKSFGFLCQKLDSRFRKTTSLLYLSFYWLQYFHHDLHRRLSSLKMECSFETNCCLFNLLFLLCLTVNFAVRLRLLLCFVFKGIRTNLFGSYYTSYCCLQDSDLHVAWQFFKRLSHKRSCMQKFMSLYRKLTPINRGRVTNPQVQGYRLESFGIITNPVGSKKLI